MGEATFPTRRSFLKLGRGLFAGFVLGVGFGSSEAEAAKSKLTLQGNHSRPGAGRAAGAAKGKSNPVRATSGGPGVGKASKPRVTQKSGGEARGGKQLGSQVRGKASVVSRDGRVRANGPSRKQLAGGRARSKETVTQSRQVLRATPSPARNVELVQPRRFPSGPADPGGAGLVSSCPTRILRLRNSHTGEYLEADYCVDGRYQAEQLAAIAEVLRDHRSDRVHPIDVHLLDILHEVQRSLDSSGEIRIVSGYRSPETNWWKHLMERGVAENSYHLYGRAVDFYLPERDLRTQRAAALELAAGGVGYYPRSGFIHVDTGPVRTW